MLPDDVACDSRNPRPGKVYHTVYNPKDLYGEDIEVDYRGYEVTPDNLMRVLTGRLPASTPSSKKLNSDEYSNILVYLTGHGGDGFIKFQDDSDITSNDIADAFEQMYRMKRYNEILFIADTCQAETLGWKTYSPNIMTLGSSKLGEDSYSVKVCPKSLCLSTTSYKLFDFKRDLKEAYVTDFFASVRPIKSLKDFGYKEDVLNSTINKLSANYMRNIGQLQEYQNDGLRYVDQLTFV